MSIVRAIKILTDAIILLNRVLRLVSPRPAVTITQRFRLGDDEFKQFSQRLVEIIEPIFVRMVSSRTRDGDCRGTCKRFDESFHFHRQVSENDGREDPFAALILKGLRQFHGNLFVRSVIPENKIFEIVKHESAPTQVVPENLRSPITLPLPHLSPLAFFGVT